MKLIDLKGKKFGRWTVKKYVGLDKYKRALWECECECGTIKDVASNSLIRGMSKSCGCYKRDNTIRVLTTHGHSKTRLYKIWQGIKRRCYNHNEIRFDNYGGKGIEMSKEWKDDFSSFEEWALSNGYQDDLTIDRIDIEKGYEPSNCRWVSVELQANNKSNNVIVEINGEKHTLGVWAKIVGISYKTIHTRYSRGDRGERLIRNKERNKNKH